MSRKPVNEISALENRQAVWEAIRAKKADFTVRGISEETRLRVSSVRDYLTGLVNAGYLEKELVPWRGTVLTWYRLFKDVGREAPRVRADGSLVTQGNKREQMWRTIWIIKQFTPRDLAIQASVDGSIVNLADAQDYCKHLAHAGYLKGRDSGLGTRNGCDHSPVTGPQSLLYLAVPGRYTGPLPPMIQRTKQVYDPNLKAVIWKEDEHDHH